MQLVFFSAEGPPAGRLPSETYRQVESLFLPASPVSRQLEFLHFLLYRFLMDKFLLYFLLSRLHSMAMKKEYICMNAHGASVLHKSIGEKKDFSCKRTILAVGCNCTIEGNKIIGLPSRVRCVRRANGSRSLCGRPADLYRRFCIVIIVHLFRPVMN